MCDVPLTDAKVSLFSDSFHSRPDRTITLVEVLDDIHIGRHRPQVQRVRQILVSHGKAAYDKAKAGLPAATFAGTFVPSRKITNLQQHSGIAHGDIDHLPDVDGLKRTVCADPRTVYVFTSPSGTGLKLGVRIGIVADDAGYKRAWTAVAAEYERLYGVTWDPSGKDISRLCFMSFDQNLYVNLDAALFDVPPIPAPEPKPAITPQLSRPRYPTDHSLDYGERAIKTAVDMIQSAPPGTRHYTRLKAARLLGGYIAGGLLSDEQAYAALAQALVGYTEDLKRALDTVDDGLAYGAAHPITLEALEAERLAWLDQHFKSRPRQPSPVSPSANPWDGINTLPIRPFARHRGIHIMGRQVRNG